MADVSPVESNSRVMEVPAHVNPSPVNVATPDTAETDVVPATAGTLLELETDTVAVELVHVVPPASTIAAVKVGRIPLETSAMVLSRLIEDGKPENDTQANDSH